MLKKFHEAALDEIYVPGSNEEVFSGRLLKVQRDHVTLPNVMIQRVNISVIRAQWRLYQCWLTEAWCW